MRCLPFYLGSNQNGYLWVPMDRPARPRCGGSRGQGQGLPAAPRRSLVTQNQAAALQRLFTLSALLTAALLHPPPELRGALLPLHRGRGSLSNATKSPLETPPLQDSLFPSPLGAHFGPSAGILGPALAPASAPRPFTSRGLHCLRAWNGYFGLPHFSGGRGSIFFSYFLLVIFFPLY